MTVYSKLFSRPQARTTVKSSPSILSKASGLFGSSQNDTQVLEQFAAVSTLWKGLTVRAENFAAVEWTLYRTNGRTGSRTPVDSHPALVMLENPNGFQDGYDFRVTYCLMMDLLGKAFIYTPKTSVGFPVNQYLLRPDRVTIEINETGTAIDHYCYIGPKGDKIPYPADEISFRRLPDPLNPLDGIGAVETLLSELAISRLSRQWQSNFFRNNAAPGGVYSFKEGLEPAEFDELTERIRLGHAGTSNANRDIILDNDASYQRVSFSMKEMMFPELREQSRDTILEGIGVPKTFLGQATDVNKASADTLEMIFGKYELTPALTRYKSWLNNDVLPRFGSKNNFVFDFASPVSANLDDQLKAVTAVEKLVAMGADPCEAMELFGLGDNLTFKDVPELGAGYNQPQTDNSNLNRNVAADEPPPPDDQE